MSVEKPSFASRFRADVSGGQNVSMGAQSEPRTMVPPKQESVSGQGSVTSRIFDTLITVSLVALFFGLPLFFTGVTLQGIAFDKQIYFYFWLLIGIVAWVSRGVTTGEMRIRRTPLDIPLILFWLFYVLAAFFSVDRWHSFWGFFGDPSRGVVSVTALVLAYYLLLSHFNPRRFALMFWSFVLSGYLVVVWSFLVVLGLHFLPSAWEKYAPISLVGTVSNLGLFLGLLVPIFLTAIFVLWKDDVMKRSLRFVSTGLLLVGLLLTLYLLLALYSFVFADASKIVILGGLSLFLVYILAQIVRPRERWVWLPMVSFVAILIFLMIGNYSSGLVRTNLPVEVTPNTTLSWQVAKDTLKENFFSGVGPANYGYAFSLFRGQEYNLNSLYTLRFYQGTGLFFEALATIGVIGTILFLLLWLSFISVGLYLLSSEKQRNKIYSLGLWSVAVMLFIASFVSSLSGGILLIGGLLAILALGAVLWESGSDERYLQLSLKAAPKFALALAFIFMVVSAGVAFLFVFMGKVFIADARAGKAVSLSSAGPNNESLGLLSDAITIYPQEGRYYTRLAQEYMALANTEAGKPEAERNTDRIVSSVSQAIAAGEQAKQIMPNDVMHAESLGLIYENAALYARDILPKAEDQYRRALELEPKNPLYFVKLGQIKKLIGDGKPEGAERESLYKESKELFEKAIEQKPNLAVAYYNLAVVKSHLKDVDGAVAGAEQALTLDRSNLNYAYNLGVLYQLRDKDNDKALAEKMFKDILASNEKLVDVRLSLGLLYEDMDKDAMAIDEYNKILGFLPDDETENVVKTREQVQTLIENVRNGTGNLANATASVPAVTETSPEDSTLDSSAPAIGAPAPDAGQ